MLPNSDVAADVGVVENHPEFIWATFEHPQLAPAYDWSKATPTTDAPVTSTTDYPFFKAGATATVKNITAGNGIYTDVFSLYPYGVPVQKELKGEFDVQVFMAASQDGSQNFNNIRTLNESVHEQLTGVWNNYFENGSLWINTEGYEGTAAQAKLLDELGFNLSDFRAGQAHARFRCRLQHHDGDLCPGGLQSNQHPRRGRL